MIYSENHHAEDRRACAVEKNGDWYRSKRHLYKSQVSQCLLVTSPLWTKSTMVAQSNPHVLGGMPWLQELQEYGANKAANKAANHQW
jgi:hypothetical protein